MDIVTTVATVPAIVAIVNLAKRAGLPTKAAAALALILGVVFNLSDHYLGADPAYQAAMSGLILGLSAAGVYDMTKTTSAHTPGRYAKIDED